MKSTTLILMLILAAFASCQSQTAVNNTKGIKATAAVNFYKRFQPVKNKKHYWF
jgi:Skp family chaperone for outer membrane proteins